MSPVQPRVPPFTSAGYLFECYYYVVIDSKLSVTTGLLPKCGEIKTFYPTGSRFFARLPLTFVTHSPARCSLSSLCYILDTHLFNFPSNCFMSNVLLSRHKRQETRTFCLNRNGFLIRFPSFCFHCAGHFVSTFVSFTRDFKIKIF